MRWRISGIPVIQGQRKEADAARIQCRDECVVFQLGMQAQQEMQTGVLSFIFEEEDPESFSNTVMREERLLSPISRRICFLSRA